MITFDFQAALKVGPESTSPHENNVRWEATVLWLDLTFWAERTVRIFLFCLISNRDLMI